MDNCQIAIVRELLCWCVQAVTFDTVIFKVVIRTAKITIKTCIWHISEQSDKVRGQWEVLSRSEAFSELQ